MINDNLASIIQKIWRNEIKTEFQKGAFCSERQLQAELYHHLRNKLIGHEIWIEPTLTLQQISGDWKIIPDLVITEQEVIVCVIELKFNPGREVHVLPDFEKLHTLSLLDRERKFQLKWIYTHGQPPIGQGYSISEELLCIYAAIAGDHAWGVKDRQFWLENNYNQKIPSNFLHLVGRIYKDKECEFLNPNN